jgi:plastocyanin
MMPVRNSTRRVVPLAVAALGVALAAAQAAAQAPAAFVAEGTIRGVVEVRRSRAATETRASSAAMAMPAHRPDQLRPAVVYLDAGPRGAFEPDGAARARMDQVNQTFVPHVLAITVGTTVDFPNSDVTFHNVFSLSKTRSFDLGSYSRGRSKAVRFDRPGVVQVFCDIHSHMSAYVLVFSHRFFAVTDEAGRYAIGPVPPGSYTLTVWYEGEVRETRPIAVPDSGGTVDAAFVVR